MIVSLNPTYYCNFRCDFCYLTEEQLSDRKLLPITDISDMLAEISQYDEIEHVDIYGGEIGLLPVGYWNDLIQLLKMYGVKDINLNTNLSMVNEITCDPRVHTSVSYDFEAREDHLRVFRNMALLGKPFSILMLAGPTLLSKDVGEMVHILNTQKNLQSVEIKPYSTNQANQWNIPYTDYENFVKKWIINSDRKFRVQNQYQLEDALEGNRSSFSDDHVYITPSGKFAVLEFDENDNEYFLELSNMEEYYNWTEVERKRVRENKFCSKCNYYGTCLSEHLREVKSIDNSCNGFIKLIEWFKNE